MKKVKNILLAVMLILFIPFVYTESTFAQSIGEIEYEEDFDFDQMFDTYENGKLIDSTEVSLENLKEEISDSNIEDISGPLLGLIGGASALAFAGIYITAIIISLATYIYSAITLKKVADKLGHPKSWFAWVPILNLVLKFQLGEQNPWLLLLGLIPIVGSVVIMVLTVIVTIKICEKLGHEKLLGLLTLIPIGAIVLWGILAWGKAKPANK
ncbi:TPA: hypothetical protein GX533_01465 [Candidatus Dojkabacteria bacterium]|uniref:Uncharacterized protein n=1 Tax=Candidatus Dojkabacteria bacterium TaxID=2099670 RepID=A0A832QDD2_9BACT|nr:hypothetical protein [Candidatus Dojkabacteria bacterium]